MHGRVGFRKACAMPTYRYRSVVSGFFGSLFAMQEVTSASPYTLELKGLHPGAYEVHAIVKHPLLTTYGSTYRCIHSGRRILPCNLGVSAAKEVGYHVGASGNPVVINEDPCAFVHIVRSNCCRPRYARGVRDEIGRA